jgi:hypothetical protein
MTRSSVLSLNYRKSRISVIKKRERSSNGRLARITQLQRRSKSSLAPFAGPVKIKNRPPKLLHELEGKEKKQVIQEMKASLQKKVQNAGGATGRQNLVVSILLTRL